MTLTVYHLKTCDTCRKAIKALKARGHELTTIDVRADALSRDTVADLASRAGWEVLLNTRSTTWRGLSDTEKTDLSEDKAVDLMTEHPTLIKRPVITTLDTLTVGWRKDTQELYLT